MREGKNICSLCNRSEVEFYQLKESIRAPNDLRFVGHTDLQAVLGKILNKRRKYSKTSNEICKKCHDKLHGIYSLTHQHTESEKMFHQITDVTVRLKKLKTFFLLADLKTETITETDKNVDSLECSWTDADIECDVSVVAKVVVKNEFGTNFEGTDLNKATKDLTVGLLGGEYSNAADGRSVEQKIIDSMGYADSKQNAIEDEIIKEEWTMQEGEIFEAQRDVLDREQTKFSCDMCDDESTTIVHENDSHYFNQTDAEHNTKKEGYTQPFYIKKNFACDHKMTHLGVTFKCNKCDQHFHNKHALDDHKLTNCLALFKCDMCGAEFKFESNLETHKLSHTNELLGCKYYCCNTKFTSKASLRHHRLSRICESCKCDQCDIKLSNKKSLRKHLKIVHPITNYSCDQCEKKFQYKHNLRLHKHSHVSINVHKPIHNEIFNCDQCDAKYKSSADLRYHKMSHTGVTFPCSKCDASFSNKKGLQSHRRGVHTDAVFFCDYCDATYKSKRSLNTHKLKHSGISFNCDQCDAKYKSNESLKQHKMSHTGVIFACNQCKASFPNERGLKYHLRRVHTGVVFSCDHCDATYKSKQALNEHMQIINGISFNCDQCGKNFKRMRHLKCHKLSEHASTESV